MTDTEALLRRLQPLIRSRDGEDAVAIVERQPTGRVTYHATEVIAVRCASDRTLRLLLKYDAGTSTLAAGLTTGAAYEALVYERVLTPLGVAAPACYGTWHDAETGATVLVRAYLDGSRLPFSKEELFPRAAAWVGRVHALAQPTVASQRLNGLNTYTTEVYQYWAARTRAFERRTQAGRAWLSGVIDRLDPVFARLLAAPQTVIHGDFYTDNMVYRDGRLAVFDWEEAAIAPGEIDLATLTYDWHDEVTQASKDAYCSARWPEGAPAGFDDTFEAARIFMYLRLLGEGRGWPNRSKRRWRVELLRRSAERLGLL